VPDQEVVHTLKGGHHAAETAGDERIDAEESVARVPVQIPERQRRTPDGRLSATGRGVHAGALADAKL
jgi:hypothetical protein